MKSCSYCGKKKPATREHIIPSWYYKYRPSPNDIGFMERAKGKIVKTELVVRDVCADCNNGELARLDGHARRLFESQLVNYVYSDTAGEIQYDYDQLVRWLLKVSYNSARAHGSDTEILSQYREVILGSAPLPENLVLRVRTIAPTCGADYDIERATRTSTVVDHPDWFRVGVFRVNEFDSMYWAFRHITINSYCFLLYAPDLSPASKARTELLALEAAVCAEPDGSATLDTRGKTKIPTPWIDSINYNLNHLGQFPLTYKLIENPVLHAALSDPSRPINYWIDRHDIEARDISNTLSFLNDLVSSREVCMGLAERVELSVHGYDDDPRELYEIPEVVTFLRALDKAWPFWMLFQHPKLSWLQVLSVCLCARLEEGNLMVDPELMRRCMERWFVSLNELSHKFAISLTVNKRVSAQAREVLLRGFG